CLVFCQTAWNLYGHGRGAGNGNRQYPDERMAALRWLFSVVYIAAAGDRTHSGDWKKSQRESALAESGHNFNSGFRDSKILRGCFLCQFFCAPLSGVTYWLAGILKAFAGGRSICSAAVA